MFDGSLEDHVRSGLQVTILVSPFPDGLQGSARGVVGPSAGTSSSCWLAFCLPVLLLARAGLSETGVRGGLVNRSAISPLPLRHFPAARLLAALTVGHQREHARDPRGLLNGSRADARAGASAADGRAGCPKAAP